MFRIHLNECADIVILQDFSSAVPAYVSLRRELKRGDHLIFVEKTIALSPLRLRFRFLSQRTWRGSNDQEEHVDVSERAHLQSLT
jgi:hypothetical protein